MRADRCGRGSLPRHATVWLAAAALSSGQAMAAPPDPAAAALVDLGGALLQRAAPSAPNAVIAPLATATALGLVQAGTQGVAEREIEALFGSGRAGARALRQGVPALARAAQPGGAGAPLQAAARMWVAQEVAAEVPAPYARRLAQRWQADAVRVDFTQPEAVRGQINRWTADRTAGRVTDLLPPGSLNPASQVVLSTAVHFKSAWERPFDAERTAERPFRTAAGVSKPVPTLLDPRGVLQTRADGQLVMELPFAGGYALLLVVPEDGQPLTVPTGAQLERWRAALQPLRCELAVPRVTLAPQAVSLKPALQALGVKAVFTDRADLRPMLGRQGRQSHLDDVHHAAGLALDERGGEAVAAVAATVSSKSLSLPAPPCAADRAFSFVLLHQASGTPLFMGRVGDPTAP